MVYFNLKHIVFVFAHWASAFLISYKTLRLHVEDFLHIQCALIHSQRFGQATARRLLWTCAVCVEGRTRAARLALRYVPMPTQPIFPSQLHPDYTTATIVTKPWFLSDTEITTTLSLINCVL